MFLPTWENLKLNIPSSDYQSPFYFIPMFFFFQKDNHFLDLALKYVLQTLEFSITLVLYMCAVYTGKHTSMIQ